MQSSHIQMPLENWETITLGKKSKDAYKEWDEVKVWSLYWWESKKWKEERTICC